MATMPFTPCSSDPCTDVTVSILQTVFGPVIRNLTLGTDPSGVDPVVNVIATMMGYFNSGVLTIATLIVSFVTVVGVINTANDGEAFGRNWSSLWTPVRIVSGGAGPPRPPPAGGRRGGARRPRGALGGAGGGPWACWGRRPRACRGGGGVWGGRGAGSPRNDT